MKNNGCKPFSWFDGGVLWCFVLVMFLCGSCFFLLWCFCFRVFAVIAAVVVFALLSCTALVALWRCLWFGLFFFVVPVALLLCYIASRRVMNVNICCC